ncbi:MAG: alanine--tRNA ligase, partial [Patescibacteria group bacterium]
VTKVEMKKSDALSQGALAFFPEKYPDVTNVYEIRGFSKELCGGPHVNSTGVIGKIKITREESAGSGVRRVYAVLST